MFFFIDVINDVAFSKNQFIDTYTYAQNKIIQFILSFKSLQ